MIGIFHTGYFSALQKIPRCLRRLSYGVKVANLLSELISDFLNDVMVSVRWLQYDADRQEVKLFTFKGLYSILRNIFERQEKSEDLPIPLSP